METDLKSDASKNVNGEVKKLSKSSPVPQRGVFTEEARKKRLSFLTNQTGCDLSSLEEMKLFPEDLAGNIECLAGAVEVPIGIGGPLFIQGQGWNENIYAPIATTEGALISSVNRGTRALNMSGGVTSRVLRRRMSRAPIFDCGSFILAMKLKSWLQDHFAQLQNKIKEYSNHGTLVELEFRHGGPCLHVVFLYETGDAAGQNMTTVCTWQASQWILARYQAETGEKIIDFMLEANMSTDKKASVHSALQGRGREAIAEVLIPEKVFCRVFRTTPDLIVKMMAQAQAGQIFTGMQGFNINVANIIAGLFTSTGQDIACVHESSIGQFYVEKRDEGIYASMHLPNLVIGTVGGGVGLRVQRQMLELMGCFGNGGADRLAEIIASYCLALDLSTATSLLNGRFVGAHERWGRNRTKNWLKKSELNTDFFSNILKSSCLEKGPVKRVTELETVSGESFVMSLSTEVTNRLCGLWIYGVKYENNSFEEPIFVKSKVKDDELLQATEMMAHLCDNELGKKVERFRAYNLFNKCHIKELELARYESESLNGIRPKTLGVELQEERETYVLVQEMIQGAELLDCVDEREAWLEEHLKEAIRGISCVHGEYLEATQEFITKEWFGVIPSRDSMVEMTPLWKELISYMKEEFCDWLSPEMAVKHQSIIDSISTWWGEIESMPKTLIHHDFNSRNITFQRRDGKLNLLAYDWELATVHIPQRDVVELLCFTLNGDFDVSLVDQLIEFHRLNVERESGKKICSKKWRQGFLYSAYDFLIYRLSLYSIAHRHRACSFLEPSYCTTMKLINFLEIDVK